MTVTDGLWNDECSQGLLLSLRKLCGRGQLEEAFQIISLLESEAVHFSKATLFSLLQGCVNKKLLSAGRKVHRLVVKNGYESDTFLGSHLIRMFAVCGSLANAKQVFNKLPNQTVFTWSAIISAHAKLGEPQRAIDMYYHMQKSSIKPDEHVFLAVLKACSNVAALRHGRLIHTHILVSCLESDIFICNTLINLYAKCVKLEDAYSVFDGLLMRNSVTWNAMIAGYAHNGLGYEALKLFHEMQQKAEKPDKFTFVSALKACSSIAAKEQGLIIHSQIIESGIKWDEFLGSALVDMYTKCGGLADAQRIFDKMPMLDVVTWNAMIAGYSQHGHIDEAVRLFLQMHEDGTKQDSATFAIIIHMLSSVGFLAQAKWIHMLVIEIGFETDNFVAGALLDMYAKCGSIDNAHKIFGELQKQDVVTWNTMIAGYTLHGEFKVALQFYQRMQWEGLQPNSSTFVSIIKACSNNEALDEGKIIHSHVNEICLGADLCVVNALIDMYINCGHTVDANLLFEKLAKRDVVSWNTMIAGYAEHYHHDQDALGLFHQMLQEDVEPNSVTFATILTVCSTLAALDQGHLIHAYIVQSNVESDVFVGNGLINMFVKCRRLADACRVFDSLLNKDATTWNAMLTGHAQLNDPKLAVCFFEDMLKQGIKPIDVTFVCLLSACSHEGLVDKGCYYLNLMIESYRVIPTIEHFHCMIDVLGRAGLLTEAKDLMQAIPSEPSIVGWMSLLNHCRTYGKVRLGRHCFDHVLMKDPQHGSAYELMASIYINANMLEDANRILELRTLMQAWKEPGLALVVGDCNRHDFIVADKSHPQSEDMYAKLKRLNLHLSHLTLVL